MVAARRALALVVLLLGGHSLALEAPAYLGPAPRADVRRIVTLAPSLTDTVLALGAGEWLVGVSRFDTFPEVAGLARVGGFVDPSIEAVLALEPDLLLVMPGPGNLRPVQKLAELGVPVLALPMHTVAQTLAAILEVGRALGRSDAAAAVVADIETTRARVRQLGAGRAPVRVLFVYDFEPLVVAGPGSFADELLRDAGAQNAAHKARTPYPVYPVEAALASAPDVVIDADHDPQGSARLRRLPGFRQARWVRRTSEDLMHPGPRLGRGLEELSRLLYPAAAQ
jgi:iron complex transport system substrate-binding protein